MPNAYFYARISHLASAAKKDDVDADTCRSIDQQVAMCRQRFDYDQQSGKFPGMTWGTQGWIGTKRYGHDSEDGLFIDQAVSAFLWNFCHRPAGGRCHAVLMPGDTLYMAYLDRGFRNWKDLAAMLQYWGSKEIRVVFVNENLDTSSWLNEMMIALMGLFSEMDSRLKSARVREVVAYRRMKGFRYTQYAPRGWKVKQAGAQWRLVPDDELRELKLRVQTLRAEQHLSYTEISDLLERERVAIEGGPILPHAAGDVLPARKWRAHKLHRLVQSTTVGLPTRLIPPGTVEPVPILPRRKKPQKSRIKPLKPLRQRYKHYPPQRPVKAKVGTLKANGEPPAGRN